MAPSDAPAQTWNAPAYVAPAKFTNVAVTVGAAPTALGGTLSLPKTADKVPAIVLIHGSGATVAYIGELLRGPGRANAVYLLTLTTK